MNHLLTIQNPATGESSCPCGWEYVVKNFRPQWPMDLASVERQVRSAFDAHVKFQTKQEVAA